MFFSEANMLEPEKDPVKQTDWRRKKIRLECCKVNKCTHPSHDVTLGGVGGLGGQLHGSPTENMDCFRTFA